MLNGPVTVTAAKPLADDSPDHLFPHGTARDNSFNWAFNYKLRQIAPVPLSVLDLGCSGGGMVASFIHEGTFAVGIEGSDYSRNTGRAEWATIPGNLFVADITAPFSVECGGKPVLFTVVTLWEVIEHIAEERLPEVFGNIDAHLAPGGLVVMSVSPNRDAPGGEDLHQTVQPREWWMQTFDDLGWRNHPDAVEWFGADVVRGGWNAPDSFHVVLTRKMDDVTFNL